MARLSKNANVPSTPYASLRAAAALADRPPGVHGADAAPAQDVALQRARPRSSSPRAPRRRLVVGLDVQHAEAEPADPARSGGRRRRIGTTRPWLRPMRRL